MACFWKFVRLFLSRHIGLGNRSENSIKDVKSFDNFVTLINNPSIGSDTVVHLRVQLENFSGTTEIPTNIGRFSHLRSLTVTGCGLKTLPWSIIYLKQLQVLDLSHNLLEVLPSTVGCLDSLEELNLEDNNLLSLPTSLIQLKKLKSLNVTNNLSLQGPSYSFCMQGLDKILEHLARRSERKNLWENSKAYYHPSNSLYVGIEVPTLLVLTVNCILKSEQDFLSPAYVPPRLKTFLLEKVGDRNSAIQVAKCSLCHTYFSNPHRFDGHECKALRS